MTRLTNRTIAVLSGIFFSGSVSAATVDLLGEQDFFVDGAEVTVAEFTAPGVKAGDPDPFNKAFGSDARWSTDLGDPNGIGPFGWVWKCDGVPSATACTGGATGSWHWEITAGGTHDLIGSPGVISYSHVLAPADLVGANYGALELGLADLDWGAGVAGDMIEILFNGIAQDVSMWAGSATGRSTFNIRTMYFDPQLLRDNGGVLNVTIRTLQDGTCIFAPDPDGAEHCRGNGIGIDYSRLVTDIPLPGAGLLLIGGLGAIAALRRRH